jgi:predicted DCC family thiol-disulfide oxidoreductase YuxK
LFDGVCNLCNSTIVWILSHDRKREFQFASLQSEAARGLLGSRLERLPDSIVLIDEDGVHVESEAGLRIAGRLGFPYSLLRLSRVLPRALRDAAYRFVARNRYRWFGRRDRCALPKTEWQDRFLG